MEASVKNGGSMIDVGRRSMKEGDLKVFGLV